MKFGVLCLLLFFILLLPAPYSANSISNSIQNREHSYSAISQPISENYQIEKVISSTDEQLFVDGLALIGVPYFFNAITEGTNQTLTFQLETDRNYIGFLFGDYLEKQVNLDVWILQYNTTEILNFTRNHELGSQDILQFSPLSSANYSVVIVNQVTEEAYSFFGFVLFEHIEVYDKKSFKLKGPEINPINETISYYSRYGVFISSLTSDINLSVSLAIPNGMITEASIFPFFKSSDCLNYNPQVSLTEQNAATVGTYEESGENLLSIPIGPPDVSWMSKTGVAVAFNVLQGEGSITLNSSSIEYFDIRFTTPIGIPQIVEPLFESNYTIFSYYLETSAIYDVFLWQFENRTSQSDLDIQIWQGTPSDAEEGMNDPKRIPLIYSSNKGTEDRIESFQPVSSGRHSIVVFHDPSDTSINISSSTLLNVFERWNLTDKEKEFHLEGRTKWQNDQYSLNTVKTFLVPVDTFSGKNLSFKVAVPQTLELEISIFPFTSLVDQLIFSPFSKDKAIKSANGRDTEVVISAEVGRRNGDRVNDTFWIISVIASLGVGEVTISWQDAGIEIPWTDYIIATTFILIAIALVCFVTWKGEEYI